MKNKVTQRMDRKVFARSGSKLGLALMAACLALGPILRADMVTDWNANTEQAITTAGQGAPVQGRFLAIVHAAIYDAVNGIERQYTPYFVTERGPRGASAEAAAAQAAYTALVSLYPAQKTTFDIQLANSLATIPGHRGSGHRIKLGRPGASTLPTKSWPGAARTVSRMSCPATSAAVLQGSGVRRPPARAPTARCRRSSRKWRSWRRSR